MKIGRKLLSTPEPKYQSFHRCKNIATGPVFIIASGASAKEFPLVDFQKVPMIVVNGAISMFLGTSIRPYFYVCTDSGFFVQQPELFSAALELSQNVVLREDYVLHNVPIPKGELYVLKKAAKAKWADLFSMASTNLVRRSKFHKGRSRSIGFSKNLSEGYFDARTVAYLALQLAYHLGFSKVFMVGVDLCPASGRFYETADAYKSPCLLDDHLHTRIYPSFQLMANKVVNAHFLVYNLSRTSKLPESLIPYKSIEEVRALVLCSRIKT